MAAEHHCGEAHGEVVAQLGQARTDIKTLQVDLSTHCRTNGGSDAGHVTRTEFTSLKEHSKANEEQITALRTMALRAFVGVLIAASAGSAVAPALKAIALALIGKM